nr:hypothetical protein [Tanacetum cinerariifolium]
MVILNGKRSILLPTRMNYYLRVLRTMIQKGNPRPPPEPPDAKFDFEPDSGEDISVVMNSIKDEFDVSNDENDDYFPFMFVIRIFLRYLICSKMFLSLLFADSEDTIFDP